MLFVDKLFVIDITMHGVQREGEEFVRWDGSLYCERWRGEHILELRGGRL